MWWPSLLSIDMSKGDEGGALGNYDAAINITSL